MKNRLKKWKKTHRQRRKARMVNITIQFDEEDMQRFQAYCQRHKCSYQKGFTKILKEIKKIYEENECNKI